MSKTFSVMTYNVHSGLGMDGKLSPLRIAEVIASYSPSIVALQELDVGLARSELTDQAHLIAASLEMYYHFHSSIQVEEGGYGNAILSRHPIRVIRGGPIPTHPYIRHLEQRGALWIETEIAGCRVQVIATHLGLNGVEKMLQAKSLVGPEWLGHPDCRPPAVLCGDFNAAPGSRVYRRLTRHLLDAQRSVAGSRPRATWPVSFPFMRIDHLFVTPDLKVREILVPKTPLTSVASDHLPLIATLELP